MLLHIHNPSPACLIESLSLQGVLLRFAKDTLKHPEDFAAQWTLLPNGLCRLMDFAA